MATLRERDFLATQLLPSIGRKSAQIYNQRITGFLSRKGCDYNHQLMVIGRAVNGGFDDGIYPNQLCDQTFTSNYAQEVFDFSDKDQESPCRCPMFWVTRLWHAPEGYNTARSAFWRVIRSVIDGLEIADVHNPFRPYWPCHIVWSNLYKIAPAIGGNPQGNLLNIQQDDCIKLLNIEIETYRPTRILFLTDLDFAQPFIKSIYNNTHLQTTPNFTQVKAYGRATIAECSHTFVVASHPQGNLENQWVNEVLQVFRNT